MINIIVIELKMKLMDMKKIGVKLVIGVTCCVISSCASSVKIAEAENASKRRVQLLVELAFLAPDVIRDVWEGSQSVGLTSEWVKSHSIPLIWKDQRELFGAL